MKVKIGDEVHDSEKEPIMVIIENKKKIDMEKVDRHKTVVEKDIVKYCAYPENIRKESLHKFMEI